tara:strand:+ start:554 stop:1177 length:624 start_codon:yes stop_codon:yes gene_type:complete
MALVKLNNNGVKDATAFGSITGLGNLILIKKQTVSSGVSSVSFVDGASSVVLDNTYKEYIFYFNNIHPASASSFTFNLSADTGSNYNVVKTTTAFQAEHAENDSGAQLEYRSSDDLAQSSNYQLIGDGIGNENDNSLSGYLHLFDPSSTTFVKHFIVTSQQITGGSQHSKNSFVAGYGNTTSAIDAVDFKMASGNIDSATISLYGVV